MHRPLKTPLSHLANNSTFSLDLQGIEARAATMILDRKIDEDWPKERSQEDAAMLTLLVKGLVEDVHRLNDRQVNPQDLCPLCAGYTWSRPSLGDDMDYTKRQCSRCDTIRDEPEE